MAELEDPDLTSFHEHITITTVYLQNTVGEKDRKTSRRDLLQLKIKKRNHDEMGGQSEDLV